METNVFVYVAYAKWLFSNSNGTALVPVDQFKLHLLLLLCVSFHFSLSLWTQMDFMDYFIIERLKDIEVHLSNSIGEYESDCRLPLLLNYFIIDECC